MLADTTLIEILLAVLAVAIGVGSFIGATRASKTQSEVAIVNIDAQAYDRAQRIYESAIETLERRVANLERQVEGLQENNESLLTSVADLRRANTELRRDTGK